MGGEAAALVNEGGIKSAAEERLATGQSEGAGDGIALGDHGEECGQALFAGTPLAGTPLAATPLAATPCGGGQGIAGLNSLTERKGARTGCDAEGCWHEGRRRGAGRRGRAFPASEL